MMDDRIYQQAVTLHNQAYFAREKGDLIGSENLYKEALALKIKSRGADSIAAAMTQNSLGEVQLDLKKLDEALINMKKALQIREQDQVVSSSKNHDVFTSGKNQMHHLTSTDFCLDARVSRENLAKIYEARGDMASAKETRKDPSLRICAYDRCPMDDGNYSKCVLKSCAKCRCVYYCSVSCQKLDWNPRHKAFCKTLD